MSNFSILLTNSNKDLLELKYVLNQTPASQIWFDCLKKAKKYSQISETRLYGFHENHKNNLEELMQLFENYIALLAPEFPEILHDKIDKTSYPALQNSLNILHRNFAHNHLIESRVSAKNQKTWHEFNALIHKIESQLLALKSPTNPADLQRCRLEFFWQEPFKTAIPDQCYKEFTLKKEFGDLQNIYTQVGRNILELFYAQDDSVPVEHIQAFRLFSANCNIYIGPQESSQLEVAILKKVEVWFRKNETKLNAAGVFWENQNKALGAVNVAQLLNRPQTLNEMKEMQNQIIKYTDVSDVIFN